MGCFSFLLLPGVFVMEEAILLAALGKALHGLPSSLVWRQRGGSGLRFTFRNSGTFIFTPRQYIGSKRHLWIMMTWNGWKGNEVISQKVISGWGGLGHWVIGSLGH